MELVVSEGAPLPTLLRYAHLIGPEVLVVDGAESDDMSAIVDLDRSAMKGFMLTLNDGDRLDANALSADLVVRMGWGRDSQLRVLSMEDSQGTPVFVHEDGRFKLVNARPAFAEKFNSTDKAAALAALLA